MIEYLKYFWKNINEEHKKNEKLQWIEKTENIEKKQDHIFSEE